MNDCSNCKNRKNGKCEYAEICTVTVSYDEKATHYHSTPDYWGPITESWIDELDMPNKVEHPVHYNRDGSMECIDEMLLIFGKEAVKNFCLLNVWKYRYRAADKNGAEDLAKSDWYLAKYKKLVEADKSESDPPAYNPYQE